MRFFKGKSEPQLMTCPSCCQLVSVEAETCDLCGADLRQVTEEHRHAAFDRDALSGSRNPYAR